MTSHSDHIRDAATFAENVRREMRAHPAEIVADLTDGLESDIASSLSDGAVLPSVEDYANDLLTGAGHEPLSQFDVSNKKITQLVEMFTPIMDKVRECTVGLAPAWWVFRAWALTQMIGVVVSGSDSIRPFFAQWGEMPILGLVLFVALLVFSIQWGRLQKPAHRNLRHILSIAVASAGVVLLFTKSGISYPVQSNMNYETSSCVVVETPNIVGMSVAEARQTLVLVLPNGFTFFDQDSMVDIASAPLESMVIQQNPEPGSHTFCGGEKLQLVIDLAKSAPTVQPQGITTTTAELPQEPSTSTLQPRPTLTTIPKKAVSTTIPKATTTTSP